MRRKLLDISSNPSLVVFKLRIKKKKIYHGTKIYSYLIELEKRGFELRNYYYYWGEGRGKKKRKEKKKGKKIEKKNGNFEVKRYRLFRRFS